MAIDTIGTNAIANDAVTAAKIPAGAVDADITAIPDGSVTTAKIADNAVTSAKALNLGRRNLIINGAMKVAQRGTSQTGVTSGGYKEAPDRYRIEATSAGAWTLSQSTTTPDGFSHSYKFDCTTANTSLSANSKLSIQQRIEGQDLQHLKKGTSGAESITLSFWVRSAKTGTYIVQLRDQDNGRIYSQAYTISSADTWEHKTLTYTGDTTGVLDNDKADSLRVFWWLVAGTDFSSGTLATAWQANDNADRAVGQVNLADSTSNDWYITGVQLEVGDTATDFEHRSYGEELALCQRYCYVQDATDGEDYYSFGIGTAETSNTFRGFSSFPNPMRVEPTLTSTASNTFFTGGGFTPNSNATARDQGSKEGCYVNIYGSGGTDGNAGRFLANNTANAYLIWSAEL